MAKRVAPLTALQIARLKPHPTKTIELTDGAVPGLRLRMSPSAHALRRTAATIAGDLGAPPHVISAMLGHSNIGGQLVAGYNKS